jgi:uncharacterized protein
MKFEWDGGKASTNRRKHGVAFDEAASVFFDPLAATAPDPDHSAFEERYVTIGLSSLGRLLTVAHTYRPGAIRIISARRATRDESYQYEEGQN